MRASSCFLPLLAQLGFDRMVRQAGYPGTQMVPAPSALLSLLTLKLLDKERLHHIDDFNCDEALGMFAGLNILPKKELCHRLLLPHDTPSAAGVAGRLGQGIGCPVVSQSGFLLAGLPRYRPSRASETDLGKPLSTDAGQSRAERPHLLRHGAKQPRFSAIPTPI